MYYKGRAGDTKERELMNLSKLIPRNLYQAAGAGRHVGGVSMERRVAGEIPSIDHPELSNQLPTPLLYSIHMEHVFIINYSTKY